MREWNGWAWLAVCALLPLGCSDTSEGPSSVEVPATDPAAPGGEVAPLMATGMRGAALVVVATVEDVHPQFAQNEYGDSLIMSTITLRVRESLRGGSDSTLQFQLEGGTVGELSLAVSDLPKLMPGDRGVFALRRSRSGDSWVPNARSLGIQRMDIDGDLSAVRRAEGASR
jgi:hypothetical protein